MEQRPWLVFFKKPQLRKYTQKKLHPTCYRKVYKVQLQLVSVFVRQNIKLCKMHFICTEFFFFRLPSSHFQHWLLWVLFLFFSKNINFVFRKRQHFNILLSWFSLCSVKALKSTPVLVFCVYSVSCQAGGSLGGRHRAVQNLCAAHWAPLSCRGAYNERKQL